MKKIIQLLFIFQICTSCNPGTDREYFLQEGLIENIDNIYSPQKSSPGSPVFVMKSRVWYRDSFAIEEVLSLNTVIDFNNVEQTKTVTKYYRFNNLRKKSFYQFKNFHDTSICFKQYSFADSFQVDGGWGFNYERKINILDTIGILGDTLINSTLYKQLKVKAMIGNRPAYLYCFFRCDKSIYPFNFDPELSDKMRCPLTILYSMDSTYTQAYIANEIKFIRNKLTPAETRVFNAWEQYAREHPVK